MEPPTQKLIGIGQIFQSVRILNISIFPQELTILILSLLPSIILRRQAISLLLSALRQEGFWDSVLCGKVAQWIVDIEAEDSEGYKILEEAKIQNLKVLADLQNRTVHAQYLKPEKTSPKTLISRCIFITW